MESLIPKKNSLALARQRPFLFAVVSIAAGISSGALGYHLIEGWNWLDSLYAAVQTVTTVGFGDVTPATKAGRMFSVFFMLIGVGLVLYSLTNIMQTIVQAELLGSLQKRKRLRKMKNLSGHYIICGAGRVGSRVVGELERSGTPFVVIERERELVQSLIDADRHVIVGDATLETTLRDAGVARARGLATCLPNDPDNVYVVLTARGMNADLHIVARAVEEQAEPKLIRAGASRVIAPIIIGGHRIAQALTKPAVSDFVDSLSGENRSLNFEEVQIAHGSVFAGKKLHQSSIGAELKVAVIAIRRPSGDLIYHPGGEIELNAGDLLVAIGRPDAMERMMKLAAGGKVNL